MTRVRELQDMINKTKESLRTRSFGNREIKKTETNEWVSNEYRIFLLIGCKSL